MIILFIINFMFKLLMTKWFDYIKNNPDKTLDYAYLSENLNIT